MMSNKKHKFSIWRSLFEVDSKYVPINALGKGSYGVVCSCVNTETNKKVAIKKINNIFENQVNASRTLRELIILRSVRHENVIALKDVMVTSTKSSFKEVYLVYELMDCVLHQIIRSPQPLSNDHCNTKTSFLLRLLRGLRYLHSANILHRDLKPANLLVNANCDLKICDFGLSRTFKDKGGFMTQYVVTHWYRAPELLLHNDNYGASVDVWSVGCIFAEMIGRKPLFPGTSSLNQLQRIINILGSPTRSDLEFMVHDVRALLYLHSMPYSRGVHLAILYPHADHVFDPEKRITITEVLQHPYLADLNDCVKDIPAHKPLDLDVNSHIGEAKLRELIWNETLFYHPQVAYSP
ncbi:Mitogen-activated protein kinase 7, partial [Bienertia sinuspersici]